ncbi:hypothetical protein ACFO5K_12690 [Nocardia halotolerans]|uniref:MarR family transcriptional regulator n=1 Tax=Nocardia halotolerans TaxID=1755878 RepID=A0ABV8VK41_9NOCA
MSTRELTEDELTHRLLTTYRLLRSPRTRIRLLVVEQQMST